MTGFWTNQFSEISVDNFESFVLNRNENKRKVNEILEALFTLVFTSHHDIIWVKISSSILSTENDLYICLCYVVPDESSRQWLLETKNMFLIES